MASVKVKHFFNGRFFEIPKYQRGFAWSKDNVRQLFDDICESIETESSHYIGTFVLSTHPSGDDHFYVVDGQQRITTISLMISELTRHLDPDNASFYRRFYIAEANGDPRTCRLRTLGRDNDYFASLLQGATPTEPQNKSQRNLREAYEEVQAVVSLVADKTQFLRSVENLEIMEFIERSEGDAIRIFQTVNDRGKPLSSMDKAKSLLIYFSNRYLGKKLDDRINALFGDIFEAYDDIKNLGERQRVNLIRAREFDEDNVMRYHFLSFSDSNYDATASYVLGYLKTRLESLRNSGRETRFDEMEAFIVGYTESLCGFFHSFRQILLRSLEDPRYYRLFSILNLSATLYPLTIRLETLGKLDTHLPRTGLEHYTFLDLIELIDVRIYKTRGTDPRAEISRFVTELDADKSDRWIQDWLLQYNQRWMPREEFLARLNGHVYGNRALAHMFIDYCQSLDGKEYTVDELRLAVTEDPTIEHILAQTPSFSAESAGFLDEQEFVEYQDTLGNLTVLEKRLNSAVHNKVPIDKVVHYDRSMFKMTRTAASGISVGGVFSKGEILERRAELSRYFAQRWWC